MKGGSKKPRNSNSIIKVSWSSSYLCLRRSSMNLKQHKILPKQNVQTKKNSNNKYERIPPRLSMFATSSWNSSKKVELSVENV
eukprot:maker-scaffold_17-snap-gene-1.1-mRNA-1 protein AED:0.35 eAED:0.35 QI:0/0.5/0.33/1/0/0/3/174/82